MRRRPLVAIGIVVVLAAGVGVGWWATRPATGIGAIAGDAGFVDCAGAAGIDVSDAPSWSPERQRELLSTWAGALCVLGATDDEVLQHVVAEAMPPVGDDSDEVRAVRAGVLMALVADADASATTPEVVDAVGSLLGAARGNDDHWWQDETQRWELALLSDGIQSAAAVEIVSRERGGIPELDAFIVDQGLEDDAEARIRFAQRQLESGTPLWEEIRDVEERIDDRVDEFVA